MAEQPFYKPCVQPEAAFAGRELGKQLVDVKSSSDNFAERASCQGCKRAVDRMDFVGERVERRPMYIGTLSEQFHG